MSNSSKFPAAFFRLHFKNPMCNTLSQLCISMNSASIPKLSLPHSHGWFIEHQPDRTLCLIINLISTRHPLDAFLVNNRVFYHNTWHLDMIHWITSNELQKLNSKSVSGQQDITCTVPQFEIWYKSTGCACQTQLLSPIDKNYGQKAYLKHLQIVLWSW